MRNEQCNWGWGWHAGPVGQLEAAVTVYDVDAQGHTRISHFRVAVDSKWEKTGHPFVYAAIANESKVGGQCSKP